MKYIRTITMVVMMLPLFILTVVIYAIKRIKNKTKSKKDLQNGKTEV